MHRRRIKKDIVYFVILLTLIICSYIIYNIVDVLRYRGGRADEIIYKNDITSDINYKAYLKPNSFISSPYIDKNYSFVTSLIDYIRATFSYKYSGNADIGINYDYYIKATLTSRYMTDDLKNNSKPLWTKDFVLLSHKTGYTPNSNININETLDIGLDSYNNLLEAFHQAVNIPLDSRLDVTFVMDINGKLQNNKTINKVHDMTMTIPLGVRNFDINVSKSFPNQEVTYSRKQTGVEVSYMLAIIYIILLLVIVGVAIYFVHYIINQGRDEYELKVNKILKEYDDRIVTVSNFIRYEKLDIVKVPSFEELLTLSDETLEPIIFFEKINNNCREAWFSIIRNRVLYLYNIIYTKK